MISTKEKRSLIFKAIFTSLSIISILLIVRALYVYNDLIGSDLFYIIVAKEMLFSLISMLIIGVILYYVIKIDIKKINNKAMNYAYTDGLTGLFNRRFLFVISLN